MSNQVRAIEVVQTSAAQDIDDVCHFVCHCTGDNLAACGLDCSDTHWTTDDEAPCPLCSLRWPDGSPVCPWGCSCEECGSGGES